MHLRQIIPVGVEMGLSDATRLVVSSVEIWTTMLVIRASFVGPHATRYEQPTQDTPGGSVLRWECHDSVGTKYRSEVAGGGGGLFVTWETVRFDGIVPDDATWLELISMRAADTPVRVPL